MKSPTGKVRLKFLSALKCGAACLFLTSCPEPPAKPIPPLDASKAIAQPGKASPDAPVKAGKLTTIPLGDLYQLVQKGAVLIYDVRPMLIYKLGHIPGAISWPKRDFERDYEKQLPNILAAARNNTPVVVYCTDLACPDGLNVGTALANRGHSVSVLQGGYEAWKIATE